MSKNILQQLYDGEIYPAENIGSNIRSNCPEYSKISKELGDEKENFLKTLSDSNREHFQKIDDLFFEVSGLYSYECFAHGFRLGVALTTEALNNNDDLARNDDE